MRLASQCLDRGAPLDLRFFSRANAWRSRSRLPSDVAKNKRSPSRARHSAAQHRTRRATPSVRQDTGRQEHSPPSECARTHRRRRRRLRAGCSISARGFRGSEVALGSTPRCSPESRRQRWAKRNRSGHAHATCSKVKIAGDEHRRQGDSNPRLWVVGTNPVRRVRPSTAPTRPSASARMTLGSRRCSSR